MPKTPKKFRKREPEQIHPGPIALLIETARLQQSRHRHASLGINHWVMALHDLFPILPQELAWDELKCFDFKSRLDGGSGGPPFSVTAMLRDATAIAIEANHPEPTIDDVALAILDHAGLLPEGHDCGAAPPVGDVPAPGNPAPGPAQSFDQPLLLARFGRDLTAEAAANLLPPVVGRKEQIALILETLCRQTKKNVALVGPAAVGKRAIVEALAQRIAAQTVPARLRGKRVIEVQLPSLLAGVTALPELDERFCGILREARDPNIIIFFDELRTITPAGHDGLTLAISNQLKPEIARGEVTCIVSGAQDDYLRFVELDASLRPWFHTWFQPIRIDELTATRTLEALELIAAHTHKMTGVEVPPSVRKWIVDFSAELLKGHRFPGKAVELFESSIAHAVSEGRKRVTLADARTVAERAIAIPADMESRLRRICKLLRESGVLLPADQETILNRLSVTLRSLDLMPVRPNAILLLAGEAALAARAVAETLADAIAGSKERVIPIDFGLLTEPWDTRQLLGIAGAQPQQQHALPLHAIIDAPWSVVLAENIDGCHSQVRASLTRALSEGYFTDSKGRKIYLSDTVVVLTAPSVEAKAARPVGFAENEGEPDPRAVATRSLEPELVEQLDLVVTRLDDQADLAALVRQGGMLADLARRYRDRGLEITWDKTLVEWFRSDHQQKRGKREWEQWADQNLASALLPYLPPRRPARPKRVVVRHEGDHLVVGAAQGRR